VAFNYDLIGGDKGIEINGAMTDRVGEICKQLSNSLSMCSWLLATCSWYDNANYLTLIL